MMLSLADLTQSVDRLTNLAQSLGFAPRGPLADRHGSIELVFVKRDNGVARFVTLAITEEDEPPDVRVELYATVEDQFRSARKQIASFLLPSGAIAEFLRSDTAAEAFGTAAHQANVMQPSAEKLSASFTHATATAPGAKTVL
jgi:hypothetical protein